MALLLVTFIGFLAKEWRADKDAAHILSDMTGLAGVVFTLLLVWWFMAARHGKD